MKLTESQIRKLITVTRPSPSGDDLYGICPKCGGDEFGISLVKENNPWNCFRKKACDFDRGNCWDLLKFLGKTKDFVKHQTIESTLSTFEEQKEKILDLTLPQVIPPVGWKRQFDDEYLRERGWIDEQFQRYQVGRSMFRKDYVTVLIEMNGKTVGYLSRSIKSKESIDFINKKRKLTGERKYLRYDNSPSEFSRMLFGYDEIIEGKTDTVILTEGWLSKTKTDTNLQLFESFELKCVSTFGAKVSLEQRELLKRKGVKNLILWFESNVLHITKGLALELSNNFNVMVGCMVDDRDPNDFEPHEAIQLLENSVSPVELNVNFV